MEFTLKGGGEAGFALNGGDEVEFTLNGGDEAEFTVNGGEFTLKAGDEADAHSPRLPFLKGTPKAGRPRCPSPRALGVTPGRALLC